MSLLFFQQEQRRYAPHAWIMEKMPGTRLLKSGIPLIRRWKRKRKWTVFTGNGIPLPESSESKYSSRCSLWFLIIMCTVDILQAICCKNSYSLSWFISYEFMFCVLDLRELAANQQD